MIQKTSRQISIEREFSNLKGEEYSPQPLKKKDYIQLKRNYNEYKANIYYKNSPKLSRLIDNRGFNEVKKKKIENADRIESFKFEGWKVYINWNLIAECCSKLPYRDVIY